MDLRSLNLAFCVGLAAIALTACSIFEPLYDGVDEENEYQSYSARRDQTLQAYDETGVPTSKKLTPQEKEQLMSKAYLLRLEKSLPTAKEREQYYNYRPYFTDDQEKIYFLELPSYEARDRFAMTKGIYFKNKQSYSPQTRQAIASHDIILGMTKEAVIQSWGEPEITEVAGNPLYGNERWKYIEFVSTNEGFQKEERIIYFSAGKVSGWERGDGDESRATASSN